MGAGDDFPVMIGNYDVLLVVVVVVIEGKKG